MVKNRITKKDQDIFATLFLAKRPLPLKKIAVKSGISWQTTKKHVNKLEKFGVVDVKKTVRRTNVNLKPSFLNLLKVSKKWRI